MFNVQPTNARWLLLLGFVLLVGCGLKDDDASGKGTQTLNVEPIAAISTPSVTPVVGSSVELDGSSSSDPEGSALSYLWTLEVPPGSSASLSSSTVAKPSFVPDMNGTYRATLVVSDGGLDSVVTTASVVVGALVPVSIQIDKPEPLSDGVKLSLAGTVNGSVFWYADLVYLGRGDPSDNHSISWDAASMANGSHQLMARILTDANTHEDILKTVTVSNSAINLSASVSGTTGIINVDVRANSVHGVKSVAAKLNGLDLATLTQANACSRNCQGNDIFRFTLDGAKLGSGAHSMVITASDGQTTSKSTTVNVPVSNAPTLTISQPADGTLVHGTLRVVGTTSTDKAGPVTTTLFAGGVQIHKTQSSAFDASYSMEGLSPGSYNLIVQSIDSTGQVSQATRRIIVTSTPELAHQAVFVLPTEGRLLAAEGEKIVYSVKDGGVVLRDLRSGTEVPLSSYINLQLATRWQISGGYVYAAIKDVDCTLAHHCIYQWSPSGVRQNLSLLRTPSPLTMSQNHPVARDGYVLWYNLSTEELETYTLYDVGRQTFSEISKPASLRYLGNNEFDFSVDGGVVSLWYWGQEAGEANRSPYDIYNWRSDTNVSTRLTSGNARNVAPQVAQAGVAWLQLPITGSSLTSTYSLMTQNGLNSSARTLDTQVTSFQAKDSLIAWLRKETPSGISLKVLTPSGVTTTIAQQPWIKLFANHFGSIVYSSSLKTYVWSATAGSSKLILEVEPKDVFITPGKILFTVDSSVYQITVN